MSRQSVVDSASAATARQRADEAEPGILIYCNQLLLFANDAYARILGYRSTDEIQAMGSFERLIAPHERGRLRNIRLELLEGMKPPRQFAYDAVRKDGSFARLQNVLNIVEWDNRPAIQSVVVDITGRKQTESALLASEERFRDFAESAADWFWEMGPDLRFTYASGRYEEIFGISLDQVLGRTREEIHEGWASSPEIWAPHLNDLAARRPFDGFEIPWTRPDGAVRDLSISGKPRFDEDGFFQGYRGVGSDITATKRAERARQESEQFLKAALDGLSAHIAIIDGSGDILAVNAAWRRFAEANGFSYSNWGIGANYLSVCDVASGEETELAQAAALGIREVAARRREFSYLEYPCHGPDEARWFGLRVTPFGSSESNRVVVAHENITERKRAEAEAAQHQAELAHVTRLSTMGEMASALAHELNQPLTAVADLSDAAIVTLRLRGNPDDELVEILEGAYAQAQRAGDIIRHLRAFVSNRKTENPRVDLNALIREMVRFTEPERRAKGATIRLALAKTLPAVVVDKIQIEQVLVNLERNSLEAMERARCDKPELTIATAASDMKTVRVTVQDSGPRLDAEGIKQLFTPFSTSKPDGMGMGLSISRSIVEAHGGHLWCEPDAKDGVAFHFTLPFAEE